MVGAVGNLVPWGVPNTQRPYFTRKWKMGGL